MHIAISTLAWQGVVSPSFEQGLDDWVILGYVARVASYIDAGQGA